MAFAFGGQINWMRYITSLAPQHKNKFNRSGGSRVFDRLDRSVGVDEGRSLKTFAMPTHPPTPPPTPAQPPTPTPPPPTAPTPTHTPLYPLAQSCAPRQSWGCST